MWPEASQGHVARLEGRFHRWPDGLACAMDDDGRKMTEMESRASRGSEGQKEKDDRPKKTSAIINGTPVREDMYGCTV